MIPLSYRGLKEIEAKVSTFGAVERIGRSHKGRDLLAIELGPTDSRALSVVFAGIHAIEWIGIETCLALLDRLHLRRLDRRVLVFPVINPDGVARVEDDLLRHRRRFRRGNARGVDLNRNFPTFYKHRFFGRHGKAPCSEPEVSAVLERVDRAASSGSTDLRVLSLHSTGRMVLYPYGGLWRRPPEHGTLRDAARAVAKEIGYRPAQCSRWVPGFFAPGMEIDHLYEAYGARALLVEMAGGFSLADPNTYASPFRWFNPADPKREAERVAPVLERFVVGEI